MKILFLDVDGVLNNAKTDMSDGWGIDLYMAFLVGKIQLDTDCEVVLSSSWRFSNEGIKKVNDRVVKLFDITPVDTKGLRTRGDEVNCWMESYLSIPPSQREDITHWAIVDDEMDFNKEQITHFFKTSFQTGLTKEIADEITNYLNK